MSDLDTLAEMLTGAGVTFSVDRSSSYRNITLVVFAGRGDKNLGHADHHTSVVFDTQGKLERWGTWRSVAGACTPENERTTK